MRHLALILVMLPLLPLPAMAAGPSLEQYYNSDAALDALPEKAPASEEAPAEPAEQAPAVAAPEAPAGGKSHVVTSVMKCYEEIGREAALEIRRTSLTPYADCQRKLREMEQQKAAAKTPAAPVAETPHNFVRVTEGVDSGHEDKAPPPAKKAPAARK